MNPITLSEVKAATKNQASATGMLRTLAALVASRLDGAIIHEAVTTESIYVSVPYNANQVRLSFHSKFGMRSPLHVHTWKSQADLAARLNRALEAQAA